VILRVGWNCRSVYEFGQHTVLGRQAGLADEEIRALAGGDLSRFAAHERTLIALSDELCAEDFVSDATWSELSARWSDGELVELLLLAGYYRLVSGFLNSAGVQIDPDVPGWPG
jgi:alkylhydroperoxidase family enzyme